MLPNLESIYLHREPVDFRKSINGLSVIVEDSMALSPFSAALFVFCNRGRDKLKVLYWDKTGFCLWYKRLEQEKFQWPKRFSETVISLSQEQFQWLLQGYDISKIKGHKKLNYQCVS